MAIIEYLDEVYPEPPLIPKDVQGRAYVRRCRKSSAATSTRSTTCGCSSTSRRNSAPTRPPPTPGIGTGSPRGLADWRPMWRARLSGQYCYGDSVTMADVCLVPQIFNAQRFGCPLDGYPTLNAIFERCMALDAFRATQPSTQADAF